MRRTGRGFSRVWVRPLSTPRTIVGPGRAIGWVVNDLIPVVVVVGVVFGVYGLAVRGLATLYDKYRHHW